MKKPRVFWKSHEVAAVARHFVQQFKQAQPSAELVRAAMQILPAERRISIHQISYQRNNMIAVVLMLVFEQQNLLGRQDRLAGKFNERYQAILDGAREELKKGGHHPIPVSSTIVVPPVDPVLDKALDAKCEDIVQRHIDGLQGVDLTQDQAKQLLKLRGITTEDLVVEIERRRYLHVESLRGDLNAMLDLLAESRKAPENVFERPAPPPPPVENGDKRKRITVLASGGMAMPYRHYEQELNNLRLLGITKPMPKLGEINPRSKAIILMGNMVSHAASDNAKRIAKEFNIPFHDVRGTAQLKSLLMQMNHEDYWE